MLSVEPPPPREKDTEAVTGELVAKLSNEINLCLKSHGLRQPVPVEVPMYKFYLEGDRVQKRPMQDMLLGVNNAGSEEGARERDQRIRRRAKILQNVVFAKRNTFLNSNATADERLHLIIRKQLPALFTETQTLFGVKFNRV